MPEIKTTTSAVVTGGPNITEPRTLKVEGVDLVEVSVTYDAANPKPTIVNLQHDKVQLLAMKSTWYGADLTYKFDAGSDVAFDQPLALMGAAIGLLGKDVPKQLTFTNKSVNNKDITVTILLGRSA